jgi:AraC-like DNA-binding protein
MDADAGMNAADHDLKTLRLSTAQFADRDAVDAFRETFGRAILRFDMEPLQDSVLEVDMTLRAFSAFGMASGLLSPMRNRHGPDLIDNDDLVLVVIQRGRGVLEQHGRRVEVREDQTVLTDSGAPATFTAPVTARVVNLRLNRALLAPQIADLGAALLAPLMVDSPALRLLKSYASSLNDETALATPDLRQAVATHMHDLAALAIGATGDAAEAARGRGLRAARLAAIKADIIADLGSSRLSIAAIATRHGVTPRYIAMLFAREGSSFTEFVLDQRLARAHRLLSDSRHADRAIGAIAYEVGFGDLSYFNRAFRRRFGATPSDVRANAHRLRQT